ncbi:MAG: hypothetical protein ACKVX7_18815 [Planctomycetota bacterium]
MRYRYEVRAVAGFVQQIATCYLRHGYRYWVAGTIPEGKDPYEVDRKILQKYGIVVSKEERARRKRNGVSNIQYLRHERFFVLLATRGRHEFFKVEHAKSFEHHCLRYGGYTISVRRGAVDGRMHAHVAIDELEYRALKRFMAETAALKWSEDMLRDLFWSSPYLPYAPVRRQMFAVLRAVNRARKSAGLAAISKDCVRIKRPVVKAYVEERTENREEKNHERTSEKRAELFESASESALAKAAA